MDVYFNIQGDVVWSTKKIEVTMYFFFYLEVRNCPSVIYFSAKKNGSAERNTSNLFSFFSSTFRQGSQSITVVIKKIAVVIRPWVTSSADLQISIRRRVEVVTGRHMLVLFIADIAKRKDQRSPQKFGCDVAEFLLFCKD